MTFDVKSHELAQSFLDDSIYTYSSADVAELSSAIQRAIEDWLEEWEAEKQAEAEVEKATSANQPKE